MLTLRVGQELAELSMAAPGVDSAAAENHASVGGFVVRVVGVCAVATAFCGALVLFLSGFSCHSPGEVNW